MQRVNALLAQRVPQQEPSVHQLAASTASDMVGDSSLLASPGVLQSSAELALTRRPPALLPQSLRGSCAPCETRVKQLEERLATVAADNAQLRQQLEVLAAQTVPEAPSPSRSSGAAIAPPSELQAERRERLEKNDQAWMTERDHFAHQRQHSHYADDAHVVTLICPYHSCPWSRWKTSSVGDNRRAMLLATGEGKWTCGVAEMGARAAPTPFPSHILRRQIREWREAHPGR